MKTRKRESLLFIIDHSSASILHDKITPMPPSYPLLLDVTHLLCVIIGGGAVASRKAHGLVAAGAQRINMIAPTFSPNIPPSVHQIHESYTSYHLDGASLVFAATNIPQVNDVIVRDARARNIFVTRADTVDDLPGDFLTPAQFTRGPVAVTVSAASPALSVMIRDQLASIWDPAWTALAEAMIELRPEIKSLPDESIRRAIFRQLATQEAIDILTTSGLAGLRDWIKRNLP
jgi:siroheme synthase-like protein